jgi:DNA-binding response OmpR family regulator
MILVTEPDGEERARLFDFLKEIDCDAPESGSGAEALAVVSEARPDLVLSEADLRNIAWPALLRSFRVASPTTDVLFMSARADGPDCLEMLAGGALDLLPKPIRRKDLVDSMERRTRPSAQSPRGTGAPP